MARRLLLSLLIIVSSVAILAWEMGSPADREAENVHAFAKLYGYVRFFHPSDEAAAIDWERFAVLGVRQVRDADTADELLDRVRRLFGPIAPTLQLYKTAEGAPEPHAALAPEDTSGLSVVAWQHKGIGLGTSGAYKSRRLNRETLETPHPTFANLHQSFDARPYRGRTVRFSVKARADTASRGSAYVWISEKMVDGSGNVLGGPEPTVVGSGEWQTYAAEGTVSEQADSLAVGTSMTGATEVWVDDFVVEFEDADESWQSLPIANASFDKGSVNEMPDGWIGVGNGYRLHTIESEKAGQIAHLSWTGEAVAVYRPLFDAHPPAGEVVEKHIGSELSVQLPVALYSRDGRTLGSADSDALTELRSALDEVSLDELDASDADLRLADVVIAWNVVRHSYPYTEVVGVEWDPLLSSTIRDAFDDRGPEDFVGTLRRMLAELQDGHAFVGHPSVRDQAGLPVRPDVVEGRLVATATDPSSPVQVGDVIIAIDGQPAMERVRDAMALRSGSERWRREVVLRGFEMGSPGSTVQVTVDRDGEEISFEMERNQAGMLFESRPPNIDEIEEGIYYVNLDRAETSEITAQMEALSTAEGVIFDLRGYPNGNHQVLQYLTDKPLRSARWNVPKMIYPDHENLAGYDTTGRWTLAPMEPRIEGKVVFLTNAKAISYAESVMGIVEHYGLGEIVGGPTAGTNGNINRLHLPGGFDVVFTGMRVLKHDGSQHHLVGIRPTVPVDRTIAAIKVGRDEYLEKAVDVIRAARRE